MPRLPNDTTDAIVFLGIDDLNWLIQGSESFAEAEAAYLKIINILRQRNISIYLITVRNYIRDPNYPFRPKNEPQAQAAMQRVTDELDDWIISLGYPTLDIRKIPDLMDDATYRDGVHLSELGLVRMSSHIAQWFHETAGLNP